MSAGIVSADVRAQKAGTFSISLVLPRLRNDQVRMKRRLISRHRHAARAVGTIRRKCFSLGTRTDRHAVLSSDLDKRFTESHPVIQRDFQRLRKVPLDFLVDVQEADDAGLRVAELQSE